VNSVTVLLTWADIQIMCLETDLIRAKRLRKLTSKRHERETVGYSFMFDNPPLLTYDLF